MAKIKQVIFDLDGTLVNTIEDLGTSTNKVLETYQYPTHQMEAYKKFVGNGVYKLIERAVPLEARKEETIAALKEAFVAYYSEHLTDFSKPYEGIWELLEILEERGVQMAVVTNKPQEQARALVAASFGSRFFKEVVGQQDGVPHKPNPTSVLRLIEQGEIELGEVLYIGDSDVDMETAKRAGVFGVGVSWGFRTTEELQAHGANVVIDHPSEVLKYLDGQ
ncbi:MAG: HAD family hydrolase [Cellulosilyticaceae bacterium]